MLPVTEISQDLLGADSNRDGFGAVTQVVRWLVALTFATSLESCDRWLSCDSRFQARSCLTKTMTVAAARRSGQPLERGLMRRSLSVKPASCTSQSEVVQGESRSGRDQPLQAHNVSEFYCEGLPFVEPGRKDWRS